jgi:hypothetical protein
MAETTITFPFYDANGNLRYANAEQSSASPPAIAPHHVTEIGGLPNSAANPIFETHGAITPTAGAAFEVAVAGVPIIAIAAHTNGIGGGKIINAGTVAGFCDFVNTAGMVQPGTLGTTISIGVGATLDLPAGLTTDVTLNSTDNNHPFVVLSW